MSYIKGNEKGYTLLLTLVLIIIIVSLFTTFAFASVNQQKQVEKTDKNFTATALAEMGVEYYRTILVTKYQEIIDTLQKEGEGRTKEEIEAQNQAAVLEFQNYIQKLYEPDVSGLQKKIFSKDEASFELLNLKFNENKSKVELVITGNYKDTSKVIIVNFIVPVDFLSVKDGDQGGGNGDGNHSGNLIPKPDFNFPLPYPNVRDCTSDYGECKANFDKNFFNDKNIKNSIIYFKKEEQYDFSSGTQNKNFNRTKFYFDGNIKFENPFDNDNYSIYANGEVNVNHHQFGGSNINILASNTINFLSHFQNDNGKQGAVIKDSIFYSKEDINFHKHIHGDSDFSNVTLYAERDIVFNSTFDGSTIKNDNYSIKLLAQRNLTFKQSTNLGTSNLFIVKGTATFNSNFSLNNSKFYFDTITMQNNSNINGVNSSTLCVRNINSINHINDISGDSYVYYLDGNPNLIQNNRGTVKKFNNEADFYKACPALIDSKNSPPVIDYNEPLTNDSIISDLTYQ